MKSDLGELDADILSQAKSDGVAPNAQAYSLVMGACVRLNRIDMALEVLNQMLEKGVHYDSGSMNSSTVGKFFRLVVDNLDEQRMREIGIQLFDVIRAHGMAPTNVVQNQLICAWKSKLPDSVLRAFLKLREQGVALTPTAYRCIMAANERAKPEFTLQLYEEMVERGVKFDRVSFNAVLCACSIRGKTSKALELFESMPQHGLVPNGKTYGTLIRACTAANRAKEAVDLFDSMRSAGIEPNRFAFHDAIYCCVKAKRLSKAMRLYREMIAAGVPPCQNTCVYLSRACQKRGWTEAAGQIDPDGVAGESAEALWDLDAPGAGSE
jgi:pentatricopeptide repeat protein